MRAGPFAQIIRFLGGLVLRFLLSNPGPALLCVLALAAVPHSAWADLGVVVADPTNFSYSKYTSAGHTLVYLSGVCPVSPVKARLCQPGEAGSVITTYPTFSEKQAYNWNIIPFSTYLQGSSKPADRLLYGSHQVKFALELQARDSYLQPVCESGHCPVVIHSGWRDIVGMTNDRDVFVYAVHTSREQDRAIVDRLNDDANTNQFHSLTNNCANFASRIINATFPNSVHRDLLNDIGMMSPKGAAKSFTHWALKHPELGFYSMHFAQQPGDLKRSGVARSGTETAIHMKKYLIPAIVLGDFELPTSFFAAYILTGRFGLYKEFARHPAPAVVQLQAEAEAARQAGDQPHAAALNESALAAREDVTGSPAEWTSYRERFAAILTSPEAQAFPTDKKRFFPPQYATSPVTIDAQGDPWLQVATDGVNRQVGLGAQNVLAPESDPRLAFQLMLGRIGFELNAKDRMRENMPEFRQDWALLEQARQRVQPPPPASGVTAALATP